MSGVLLTLSEERMQLLLLLCQLYGPKASTDRTRAAVASTADYLADRLTNWRATRAQRLENNRVNRRRCDENRRRLAAGLPRLRRGEEAS